MRITLLAIALAAAQAVSAQQSAVHIAPPVTSWQNVQALTAGASLQVKARKSHANCKLRSVDADTLICTSNKDIGFQRADILSIKIPRRGRSTLIAMGIGAGAGAIVGAATTGCSTAEKNSWFGCFLTPTRPQGAAIGAVLFGVIGAPIGALTDFARSTVYKAP